MISIQWLKMEGVIANCLRNRWHIYGFAIAMLMVGGIANSSGLPACLQNTNWSSNPISRDNLVNARVAVRTDQGNLALLSVRSSDRLLVDQLELFTPSGGHIFSRQNLSIRGSYTFNVDTGVETSEGADLWWHAIAAGVNNLEPQNRSQLYLCPATRATMQTQLLPSSQIATIAPWAPQTMSPPVQRGGIMNPSSARTEPRPPQQTASANKSAGRNAPNGAFCTRGSHCVSGSCQQGIGNLGGGRCAPRTGTAAKGAFCFLNSQCASENCVCPGGKKKMIGGWVGCLGFVDWQDNIADARPGERPYCDDPLPNGVTCLLNSECSSGYCANGPNGRCSPRDGTGMAGDYCHHHNHCATKECICPGEKSWGFCKNWEAGSNLGVCR